MILDDIDDYLNKHMAEKINVGQSGADVYVLDNKYILKRVIRNKLENQEVFLSYKKEAHLYQAIDREKLPCLPEVLATKDTDEEIILLMKKYRVIEHSEVNERLLLKIMKAIAMVHHYQVPEFLLQNGSEANILSDEQITDCVKGWTSVLNEHKDLFDEKPLEIIAANINSIILWHVSGEAVLNHGDFHLNNLVMDEEGNIVICDWQSVSTGVVSNDLGFFLSRLNADGLKIKERALIAFYSEAVNELYGKIINSEVIYGHMSASMLITSFLFWHEYLHGTSEDRVRTIYEKMVQSILIDMHPLISGSGETY